MKNKRKKDESAFTIVELIVTMVFVAVMLSPVLNSFQVGEKLSSRSRKSFIAQNLAREMISEISRKPFYDPDGDDTVSVSLLPGPSHEEYSPNATPAANGTDEVTGRPRMFNSTILDRTRYYDDIDDYDGYNSDEILLPTLSSGNEYTIGGENLYRNFRVKVRVTSETTASGKPSVVLRDNVAAGEEPVALALLTGGNFAGKYSLVADAKGNKASIINNSSGRHIDNGPDGMGGYGWTDSPATPGTDPISLSLRDIPYFYDQTKSIFEEKAVTKTSRCRMYDLGKPVKAFQGPTGDRFHVLHKTDIDDYGKYSAVTSVDMNEFNTPEVSFHNVDGPSLVAQDLRSNSINAILVSERLRAYAATNGAGLMVSDDNGSTWSSVPLEGAPAGRSTVNCVAKIKVPLGSLIIAGGRGGLWCAGEGQTTVWKRAAAISSTFNVTAVTANDSYFIAAGTDDGTIFISRTAGLDFEGKIPTFIQKNGPLFGVRINSLTIDDNCVLWAATETGLYYSTNAMDAVAGIESIWKRHMPDGISGSTSFKALHIDRSSTFISSFINVLNRESGQRTGNICSPSLLINDSGIHLFYLDDADDNPGGSTLGNPKLWYVNSSDFGKTWGKPVKISRTPQLSSAWVHSAAAGKDGSLHVIWNDNRDKGIWKLFYQRSLDGGRSWLSQDRCIANQKGERMLDDFGFKQGAPESWAHKGADFSHRITVSSGNHIHCSYTYKLGRSTVPMAREQYVAAYAASPDGGVSWFNNETVGQRFPTNFVQGAKYLDHVGELFTTFYNYNNTGDSGTVTGVYGSLDGSDWRIASGLDGFSMNNVKLFSPVSFNAEMSMILACKQYSNIAKGHLLYSYVCRSYPFPVFNEAVLNPEVRKEVSDKAREEVVGAGHRQFISPIDASKIFKPQMIKEKAYVFVSTQPDSTLINSPQIKGRAHMLVSDNYGIDFSFPIFVDYLYDVHDNLTTAAFDSTIYIVKKTYEHGKSQNFGMAMIPSQMMFAAGGNELDAFAPGLVPTKGFDRFEFDETVNCVGGDDCGTLLYGTSKGLYIRETKQPTAVIGTGGSDHLDGHLAVIFPPKQDRFEAFPGGPSNAFRWKKCMDGIFVTSVWVEKGGTFWAATARDGIFRTNDRGITWKRIEARLSNIIDISYNGKGSAQSLNALNVFTRRYNLKDPADKNSLVIELLHNKFNLTRGVVESSTVVAEDPANYSKEEKLSKAASSYDGNRIIYFDSTSKKLFSVKPADVYHHDVHREFLTMLSSGIKVYPGDTVEIFSQGMIKTLTELGVKYVTPSGMFHTASPENNYRVCKLQMTFGATGQPNYCVQNNSFNVGETSEVIYGINLSDNSAKDLYESIAAGDNEKIKELSSNIGTGGYFSVRTRVTHSPEFITDGISGASAIVSSPDNSTIYVIDKDGNRIYEIENYDSREKIRIREYSNNLNKPFNVLFSPKNERGSCRPYAVCVNSIVDLHSGSPFFEGGQQFSIVDAAADEAGDVYFIDSLTKKLFKCSRAAEKTAYVTVVDAEDGVNGAMPPFTICKKFFSSDVRAKMIPSRDFIKYEFVYTSKKYPDGIRTNEEILSSRKFGNDGVTVVYVIDNHLTVHPGSLLQVNSGTLLKFATADKTLNRNNYGGNSPAGIRALAGGKLIFGGGANESDHIVMTSLDDNSVVPSIYSAPDKEYMSSSGLVNTQLRKTRSEAGDEYHDFSGARFGDWGISDGKKNSFGGIAIKSNSDMNMYYVDSRFGLFYTSSLYPDGKLKGNFYNKEGFYEWKRSNVFVVNGVENPFKISDNSILRIDQGVTVKIDPGCSINFSSASFDDITDNSSPSYFFISDGSIRYPNYFLSTGIASYEESSPGNLGFMPWEGINFSGTGEVVNIRGSMFLNMNRMRFLNRTSVNFNTCAFGNEQYIDFNHYQFSFTLSDRSRFDNCTFNINPPCGIMTNVDSCTGFYGCHFHFLTKGGLVSNDPSLISSMNDAALIIDRCYIDNYNESESQGFGLASKIKVSAFGYLTNNTFMPGSSSSSEIVVAQEAGKTAWSVISGNTFNSCNGISVSGFERSNESISGKIFNNAFNQSNSVLRFGPVTNLPDKIVDNPADPRAIVVDRNDNLYVADEQNRCVYKYSSGGRLIRKYGGVGMMSNFYYKPAAVAVNSSGEVFVGDNVKHEILKMSNAGLRDSAFETWGGAGMIQEIGGMAILSSETGESMFVSDRARNVIMKFDGKGNFKEEIGGPGRGPDQFNGVSGLGLDPDGNYLYAADTGNHRIQKIEFSKKSISGDHFAIISKRYSTNSATNLSAGDGNGFVDSDSAEEGDYLCFVISANSPDGKLKPSYAGGATLTISGAHGKVFWEGRGVSATEGLSVRLDSSAFAGGVAVVYVRCTEASPGVVVSVRDNTVRTMTGNAIVSWTAEPVPPCMVYVGANGSGFRKYVSERDSSVTFIKIPAASFERGDVSIGIPVAEVRMSPFYISETLITNGQFSKWRDISGAPPMSGAWKRNDSEPYPDHPASQITWLDARNYSYWLITGLNSGQSDIYMPTEAMCEKAMRGPLLTGVENSSFRKPFASGTGFDFQNFNTAHERTLDERRLIGDIGTTPVRKYPAQGYFGLFDVTGNVNTWCRDGFTPSHTGVRIDPVNTGNTTLRTIKCGSFEDEYQSHARCSFRRGAEAAGSQKTIGIRIAFRR